jgi:demethylmenaquinone methyltransferase/2-methoxy-6-polyprenyl-1,4-benzoquinol methylase
VPDERNAAATEHATRIRDMFAGIAARYDLLNHLLSANMDKRWRKLVASRLRELLRVEANLSPSILDLACGTGDLSLTLFEAIGGRILGTDFCRPMLEIGAAKAKEQKAPIRLIEADALYLPFANGSFDGLTIAFGLRNLSSPEAGLHEILRVLKPGGIVAILEFSKPVVPGFRWLFQFYFRTLLPLVGGIVSGSRSAYQYLPESVSRFADQEQLAVMMRRVGFSEVSYQNLTGGIAALHLGRRRKTLASE